MPNIAVVIRAEIERMVSREVRKATAASELAQLRRRVAELEKALAAVKKEASGNGRAKPAGRRGRQFKATPQTLRKIRARLGVTQAELAKLVGVSGNAAWQWEAGRAAPRGRKVKAIQELTKIGKREVRRRLAEA
jgi:DNA-binding transcriptional regulator YiaG